MRFSRARYVTLCQQSLVTAAVLAVGVSAAGVKTLDIVPQPGPIAGVRDVPRDAPGEGPRALPQDALTRHADERSARTQVDTAPVTPKVREVKVKGISTEAAGAGTNQRRTPAAPRNRTETTAPDAKVPETKVPETKAPETKAPAASKRLVAVSDPQPVRGYATVGVTWKHGADYSDDDLAVQVRTSKHGVWADWITAAYHDDHGPDGGSTEEEATNERPGTDALVIGDVDQVQMRAETRDGSTPPDLKLAVIDPGSGNMVKQAPAIDTSTLGTSPAGTKTASGAEPQAAGAGEVQDTVALSAMKRAPKPKIYSRAQWGANERLREQSAPDYGTVKTGFIHHTVNANNYSSAQVPALLRGIYAYHTQSRGWRDIGYNYLVDRFGRIWEGRYGGVDRAVVGAHTLGYNEVSFAMSAIGNFDIASPPQAVLDAYARLFAWKLSIYDIAANSSRIYVKNRYLQAINGHRDVGQTACPGRYLYAKLPGIRRAARRIQLDAGSQPPTTPTPPSTPVFTSPTQQPQPAVTQPANISLVPSRNLAGTTHPDLILKSRSTGGIRVLPTGGQTAFKHSVSTPGRWKSMDLIAAVGDVSGDGKGDVLGRVGSSGLTRVYRGNGLGGIRTTGAYVTSLFKGADLVTAAGDWNGDHKPDVLMREKAKGWLYLVPGKGRGAFGTPVRLSRSWSGYSSTTVAGDMNHDGRPDIVAVKNGVLYVVPNTASGALGTSVKGQRIGSAYDAVLGGARDLNGDSTGDLVLRSASTSRLSILVGRSNASFGPSLGSFPSPAGLTMPSAAQMMGGSHPDVVGTDATGSRLVVLPSNDLVNIYKRPPTNLRVPTATQLLNVGDWDKDGKGDIITRQSEGDMLMLRRGRGDGKFSKGLVMSEGWAKITRLSAVGDVTGDGRPDLLGKTSTGPMTIFPGNGKSSFKAPVLAPASVRTFNQVGKGSWKPAEMPGSSFISSDGSFVPFSRTTGEDLSGYDWVIGAGDVSGNGVPDLVARDSDGTLWLLPGTSRGYGERRFLSGGYSGYSLGG